MKRIFTATFAIAVIALALFAIWRGKNELNPDIILEGEQARTTAAQVAKEEDGKKGDDVKAQSQALLASPRSEIDIGNPSLSGRLVRAGKPLAGRTVLAIDNWQRKDEQVLHKVTSESDGTFFLPLQNRKRLTLSITGEGIPNPWTKRWVEATEQGNDLGDIEIPLPGSLQGMVTDENQRALAGVRVFHSYRHGHSTATFHRSAALDEYYQNSSYVTDADGSFRFGNLPPGDHFVLAESRGFTDATGEVKLSAGVDHNFGALVIKVGRQVHGRVFDAGGSPIAEALVAPGSGSASIFSQFVRKGIRTGADGAFEVSGISNYDQLIVTAEGYAPYSEDLNRNSGSLVITLRQSHVLSGKVTGTGGRVAIVRLEGHVSGRGRLPPGYAYTAMGKEYPTGVDGRFVVTGLGPGDYEVRADVEGYGSSKPVVVSLPTDVVIEVPVERDLVQEVLVVDDTGVPIPGAQVVRDPGIEEFASLYRQDDPGLAKRILKSWRKRARKGSTDKDGIVRLPVEPGVVLAIAAQHEHHLATGLILEHASSEPVRITLQRGGIIHGTLSDAGDRKRWSLAVRVWPVGLTDKARTNAAVAAQVDAQGKFRSQALAPGNYAVGIYRYNMTWQRDPAYRLQDVTALLGAGIDGRDAVTVSIGPGDETEVELKSPAVGWIRGRVFLGGQPQADVVVFATDRDSTSPFEGTSLDDVDAHAFLPYATTDAEGRFAFAYATPGSWLLRARHPDAAYPTAPIEVRPLEPALELTEDIHLSAAEVRGSCDQDWVPADSRKWFKAYLFRLDEAADNPFCMPHHGLAQTSGMRVEPVGKTGSFRFRNLPEGRWVLRLKGRGNTILYQAVVETTANLVVDLGQVQRPIRVAATVACNSKKAVTITIRRIVKGAEKGVFECSTAVAKGQAYLGTLIPGKYTLEAFSAAQFGWGQGESLARPVTIEVSADGSVKPATVF